MFYFSKYLGLRLRLKPSRTTIVDGIRVFDPSVVIQFQDGRYYPSSKKEEAAIDEFLARPETHSHCKKITDAELAKNKAMAEEMETVRQKYQGNKSKDAGGQDAKPSINPAPKKPVLKEVEPEEEAESEA